MEFINYNKGQSDTNDGLISYQDLMGLHEFTDNPINNPVEPYEDFRGRGVARRKAKKDQKQARKIERINVRNQGKVAKKMSKAKPLAGVIKKAQDNRAKKLDVNKQNAKANVIAAKNSGKSDPVLAAALKSSKPVEEKKSNTGLIIGVSVGAVILLGVGAWLIIKKPWKKK